jgi:hypothetical protein
VCECVKGGACRILVLRLCEMHKSLGALRAFRDHSVFVSVCKGVCVAR